ncbi:hypothetical protein FBU30_006950 [Linnemannia zychae]|nr:hypothetical protein FBU30_006950 [Linnemannia zychae]
MTDYNRKVTFQLKVAANLLKFVKEAAGDLPPLSSDRCVRVLENACSHGINSVDFALAVCQAANNRDASATVSFTFNDLPENNFDKVLALISNSAVAAFNPTLHTLGKSMYSPLMEPGTIDLAYSCMGLHWVSNPSWLSKEGAMLSLAAQQAREDFDIYVSSRHKELRQGGKLVLSFPGVRDGESGINCCYADIFQRAHEIAAERGAASLSWMQRYCSTPVYGRNRAEVENSFDDADWNIELMELQDIDDYGASEYRAGQMTLDEIGTRTANMLIAASRGSLTHMWVEYGGLRKDQTEYFMTVWGEALHQALKELKSLRVYQLWVIVATKK